MESQDDFPNNRYGRFYDSLYGEVQWNTWNYISRDNDT